MVKLAFGERARSSFFAQVHRRWLCPFMVKDGELGVQASYTDLEQREMKKITLDEHKFDLY